MSVVKNWNNNTVNWDELIENWDFTVKTGGEIKATLPGFFVGHKAHFIKKVQDCIVENNFYNDAHAYFNLTPTSGAFKKHRDANNVYYWQCIGKTKWIVDGYGTFILEPGDLIYIPSGVFHEVIPLTPRLGISMAA